MINILGGQITADKRGATPNAMVGQHRAGLHLTKGYTTPDASHPTTPNTSPLNLKGEADLAADTKAEVDQILGGSWFFGFIQVARIENMSASWEGRRTGEGSVDLTVVGFPVSQDVVALDSDPANQPFFNRNGHAGSAFRAQPGQRRQVQVNTDMGDHPNYREFLITANTVTRSPNFLHLIAFKVAFTTVFVGRDGNGPILPIAHINWKLDLSGEFKWSKRIARAVQPFGTFDVGNSIPGAPADPMITAVLDNPGPPLAKQLIIDKWRGAIANPRMRQESAKRALVLRNDFFL